MRTTMARAVQQAVEGGDLVNDRTANWAFTGPLLRLRRVKSGQARPSPAALYVPEGVDQQGEARPVGRSA